LYYFIDGDATLVVCLRIGLYFH